MAFYGSLIHQIRLSEFSIIITKRGEWPSGLYGLRQVTEVKGAGSRNANKNLSKRRFCSIFDRPHHRDFPLFLSK